MEQRLQHARVKSGFVLHLTLHQKSAATSVPSPNALQENGRVVAQLHAALPPAYVPPPRRLQRSRRHRQEARALVLPPDVATVNTLHMKSTVLLQMLREHVA